MSLYNGKTLLCLVSFLLCVIHVSVSQINPLFWICCESWYHHRGSQHLMSFYQCLKIYYCKISSLTGFIFHITNMYSVDDILYCCQAGVMGVEPINLEMSNQGTYQCSTAGVHITFQVYQRFMAQCRIISKLLTAAYFHNSNIYSAYNISCWCHVGIMGFEPLTLRWVNKWTTTVPSFLPT